MAESHFWYPARKTARQHGCRAFDDLNMIESDQIQEIWVIDGSVGPEVMVWNDGLFVEWWPCLTVERARNTAKQLAVIYG